MQNVGYFKQRICTNAALTSTPNNDICSLDLCCCESVCAHPTIGGITQWRDPSIYLSQFLFCLLDGGMHV